MNLSFEEGEFLMFLIENYYHSFPANTPDEKRGWSWDEDKECDELPYSQIEDLWRKIQDQKLSHVN